ncbi:hypothetical protein NUU61_006928 [Penicillium alfredii]|uniref:Histone-lysine N-methyltransferase SET5 n=1 Tax=Penicillium alfredii TaxID=1506179 RepID=A0A9W9F1S7_9EURO|nr:uncharacterized protein NUU61_006928 [Penicillium alfredii]KAJ5092058.1 hypothetical protein NUU61_006928 [Penicillium alfredii]
MDGYWTSTPRGGFHRPIQSIIRPPAFTQRPETFEDIEYGPFVSKTETKVAYDLWSLPDKELGTEWQQQDERPYTLPKHAEWEAHVLAENVYRAYAHNQRGHFELAIGDAYRARLLCDVLGDGFENSRQPDLYAQAWHAVEQHLTAVPQDDSRKAKINRLLRLRGLNEFTYILLRALEHIIILSLAALNSWDDFQAHFESIIKMTLRGERDFQVLRARREVTMPVYPYDADDFDRTDVDILKKINLSLFDPDPAGSTPWAKVCEVKPGDGRSELGFFATVNIAKGDLIHYEEPVIRGHLHRLRMQKDQHLTTTNEEWCDNCKRRIGSNTFDAYKANKDAIKAGADPKALIFCNSYQLDAANTSAQPCLKIARDVYHFDSCWGDWAWLHDAMQPCFYNWMDREHISHTNEHHGTFLSLLLRNVLEITLRRRKKDPGLLAHEISKLLLLDDDTPGISSRARGHKWFPFTMAANIQIVLRKLLANVVPWEESRRGVVPDMQPADKYKNIVHPDEQNQRILANHSFEDFDPTFKNLYLFPGLSMFNHSCLNVRNAEWGYDDDVPNRVVKWALKNIAAGEETRVSYQHGDFKSDNRGMWLLGSSCNCPQCDDNLPRPSTPPADQDPRPAPTQGANASAKRRKLSDTEWADVQGDRVLIHLETGSIHQEIDPQYPIDGRRRIFGEDQILEEQPLGVSGPLFSSDEE